MKTLAAIVAALLGFLALVFGFGKVQQKRGRSEEQARFNALVRAQEEANADRAKAVAAAPGRSRDERRDLVRRLSALSRRRQAHLSTTERDGE